MTVGLSNTAAVVPPLSPQWISVSSTPTTNPANRGKPKGGCHECTHGKPLYLVAAEKAAARRGVSVETVLEEDLKRINEAVPYDFSDYEDLD
jgi:hypothetical protein